MYVYFWWGIPIKDFLFFGFDILSLAVLLATCMGLLMLGVTMEWLGLVQAQMRHNELVERQKQLRRICPSESDSLLAGGQQAGTSAQHVPVAQLMPAQRHSVVRFINDLCLWLSQQCIGYILMLSVMAYNGYLIIAVVLGYAIGYFLFGQTAIKIKLKNCQVKRDTFCMSDCGDPDKAVLIMPESSHETNVMGDSPQCHGAASSFVHTNAPDELQS